MHIIIGLLLPFTVRYGRAATGNAATRITALGMLPLRLSLLLGSLRLECCHSYCHCYSDHCARNAATWIVTAARITLPPLEWSRGHSALRGAA